jgi:PAS domain S-box-containing protein
LDQTAIVIVDSTGIIRYWSGGAEKAFGHPAERAVGRSLDLIVPEEFRNAHWTGFRRAMAAGSAAIEGLASDFPVVAADGQTVTRQGKLTLLRGVAANTIGAMVIFGS